MRVNHNWFALVTVELADRCRRGARGGGWAGWSAHWERRIEGEEEERGRGEIEDVSSHAFIRNVSRGGLFPFLSMARSSV